MMNIRNLVQRNVDELAQIGAALSEEQLIQLAQACMDSQRIFFSGMGRSGNMVKALAIRFMHLGFDAYVAGDAATPSIQAGDLLIAVTSSAKTKVTLNHIAVAQKIGARVALIAAATEAPLETDCFLSIPARTKVPSAQHAGSLFEQSVLVVGDAITSYIQEKKNVSSEYMDRRHANLQ